MTPRELRVRSSMPPRARYIWPRDQITEIKLNRSDGTLLVPASGRDMLNLYIGSWREVTEWVAHRLSEALLEPAAADAASAPPPPAPAPAETVSHLLKTVLLSVSACMIATGIAMMFLGLPWVVLGLYLVILASAPVGIALGTQDKEYYV